MTHLLHELWRALSFAFGMTWEILWALILGFALSSVPAGRRLEARDAAADARRLAEDARRRGGSRRRVLVLLLRLGRPRASLFRRGRRLHRRHGLRVRLDAPRLRARVCWRCCSAGSSRGRVHRRPGDDHARRDPVPVVPASGSSTPPAPRPTGPARVDGGPRRDGHVHQRGGLGGGGCAAPGLTSIGDYFVMNWAAVWRDIAWGCSSPAARGMDPRLVLAGPVPRPRPGRSPKVWGPVIGPPVAIISFVCSVGNVPLAAVLWNGGISFGGVISVHLRRPHRHPRCLIIYRKYYGTRMMLFIFVTFSATMVVAGLRHRDPVPA